MSGQLGLVPGAFVCNQTLFHLFEVGLDILLYVRQSLDPSERADDLLANIRKKKQKDITYSATRGGKWVESLLSEALCALHK